MKEGFILPKIAETVFDRFKKAGHEIYLVGGAVRDILLKKEISDCDFTTNATPEQIQKIFEKTVYNNAYGTVTIILDDGTKAEITPFRREQKYSDHRHPEKIEWAKTIEEDLSRRDFTINAIAYDGQKLIDPYNGSGDLKDLLLRAVLDPDVRFKEDALRLIRAIRFASQLGCTIEEKTQASIKNNAELISHISWERIRDEFLKIIISDHPGDGILLLRSTGLLKYILPEVDACFGVEQISPERHHIDDVGTHLVKSLNACSSHNPITRFAVFLHDIGKVATFSKDKKTNIITFYNHEMVGAQLTEDIAKRFRLSKEESKTLVTLVRHHMFTVSEVQTDKAIKRFIRNVGVENLDEAIAMRIADRVGSGAAETSWRTELFKKRLIEVQKEPFSVKDLKINGTDVMKILSIKPGPRVGAILNLIFEKVEEGSLINRKDDLVKVLEKQELSQV